jgi:hypothetical protein
MSETSHVRDQERRGARRRLIAFVLIAGAMIAIALGFVAGAALRRASALEGGAVAWSGASTGAASAAAVPSPPASLAGAPHLVFRNLELAPSEEFGRIALGPLERESGDRRLTALRCVRVHFASGQGLCLEMDDDGSRKTTLRTFGADLAPRWSMPVSGLPSRARVSPDGRYGAVTVFVTGHSYSDEQMSTRTTLFEMAADKVLVDDLEQLEVQRDGARWDAPDRNFWGVTFARDANRFYATISSGGKTWLLEGDIAARRMRALRENVECPSMSPDGKRLAFKKRVGGPGVWRLHVLDLATLEDRALAGEERAIDDQVEWLDDAHILYKHGANVWSLATEGEAKPALFLSRGSSPAVVRP